MFRLRSHGSKSKLRLLHILIILTILAIIGCAWWLLQAQKAPVVNLPDFNTHQLDDNQQPRTEKPPEDQLSEYEVAADLPHSIIIPKLSVEAIVRHVGLTSEGNIAAPANIHETGWYTDSAKPGQPGAMLIDGHASNWNGEAVFHKLHQLELNDEITVNRGDDKVFAYRVVSTQEYDVENIDMKKVLAPFNPESSGLNLITCIGNVIEGTDNFEKRLVVFAEQI